jgi:hypothetical protein
VHRIVAGESRAASATPWRLFFTCSLQAHLRGSFDSENPSRGQELRKTLPRPNFDPRRDERQRPVIGGDPTNKLMADTWREVRSTLAPVTRDKNTRTADEETVLTLMREAHLIQ